MTEILLGSHVGMSGKERSIRSMRNILLRILPEAVLQSRRFPRTYYVKWKLLQKYKKHTT